MSEKRHSDSPNIERREVLKSSGFAATTAIGIHQFSKTAKAESQQTDGDIHYGEVEFEFRNAPDVPKIHNDNVADLYIGLNNHSLTVTQFADDNLKQKVKNSNSLIKGRKYRTAPAATYKGVQANAIPIGSGAKAKVHKSVSLPIVNVSTTNSGSMNVSVQNRRTTVSPRSSTELELSEKTIPVTVRGEVQEKYDPKRDTMKKARMFKKKQHTFKPVAKIRNYGKLDVTISENTSMEEI